MEEYLKVFFEKIQTFFRAIYTETYGGILEGIPEKNLNVSQKVFLEEFLKKFVRSIVTHTLSVQSMCGKYMEESSEDNSVKNPWSNA